MNHEREVLEARDKSGERMGDFTADKSQAGPGLH